MNNVILCGRLVRDPEMKMAGETKIANYTLAVDRRTTKKDQNNDQPTADFIPCVALGRSAEFTEKYFHKGLRVLVEGRIQTRNYTNKNGQKVYVTEVFVDSQEFADGKNSSDNGNQAQQPRQAPQASAGDEFMRIPDNVEDEGLPFN